MTIDLTIALLLIWGIVNGARKGFVSQLFSLIVLTAGLAFSCKYHSVVSVWLSQYIVLQDGWMALILYSGAFLLVILLMTAAGRLVEWLLSAVMLGWLNRLAGSIFGFLKHLLFISFVLCLLNATNQTLHFLPADLVAESKLYHWVDKVAPACLPAFRPDRILPPVSQPDTAGSAPIHSV